MNFKKDLSKLAFIASEGKGRLVTIKYTDQDIEHETSMFIWWVAAITTEIFGTDIILDLLEKMSSKNKAELLEEGKTNQITLWDEFYTNMIKDTLAWGNRYSYVDFDRYQDDNICPKEEVIWMSLWFLSKITKLFEEELQYVFMWEYIVWVKAYSATPLFMIWGRKMPRQLNLLSWEHE